MFCIFCERFENSKWPPFWLRQNFFENCDGHSAEIPCGSKILSKSLYLARFSRISIFLFCNFCEKFENSKWPPFWARQNIFENWDGHSAEIPCGSKISSKSLYLARFSRYKHFLCFATFAKNSKIQNGRQFWRDKFFFLKIGMGTLQRYPVGKKFRQNRSISHKIAKIRVALKSSVPVSLTRPNNNSTALSSFEAVSEDDILKILKSSTTKSCDLDPIPTALVKECADILVTPITNIINYSLREGSFPNCFKTAYVTPLLKKPNLDRNLLKNYRPVSNLSFIFKLNEKVVAKQLNNYIDSEGLSNVNQSAYRRLHSTESALLKIQNDIAASMDSGKAVALTLLDLSAAFDTFFLIPSGIDGTVLRWIKSYLSNRKQKVKLGNSFSDAFSLPYGVPQGSVLGPLLFTLYTTPLSNIISNSNVTHHLYADHTQIYLALDHRNFDSSFAELTECLTCVQTWMAGVKQPRES